MECLNPIGDPPSNLKDMKDQPLVMISWIDSIIFSNALTEYINFHNGTNYDLVYYKDTDRIVPLRSSIDNFWKDASGNYACCTQPIIKVKANGFRLPNHEEWLVAASYLGTNKPTIEPLASEVLTSRSGNITYYWTPGQYASGSNASINNTNIEEINKVAWSNSNSNASSHSIKLKRANFLGFFDMSGNISEFNINGLHGDYSSAKYILGGNYFYSKVYLKINETKTISRSSSNFFSGIRIARNKD